MYDSSSQPIEEIIQLKNAERILQTLTNTTLSLTPKDRTTLIETLRKVQEPSWAYHALIMIPNLASREKDGFIEDIVKSRATSWADRAIAFDSEYRRTHSGREYFEPSQLIALRETFSY